MIGAAFGAFGQGLAAGFLAQRRMADVAGKGLMGLIQGGAGAAPAARAEMSAMTQSLAPAAAPQPPQWAQQYPGNPAQPMMPAGAPNAPSPQAAPAAPVAAAPAATPTPAAAEAAQAPVARGVPVPQGKPGDGLVWSDRGPGDRLMMVRRDALRRGEQSFAVTEGTIGAGRGLPSMEATSRPTTGADTVAAAPVTPVTVEDLDPLPRGMGGPLKRNGPTRGSRGASLATVNGGGGADTLQGGAGADMRAPATPFKTADPVATDLPAHARAFLNGVAGGESGGRYDIRYTPKGGVAFQGFDRHPRIYEKGPHGKSSAAGRYQFTYKTWKGLMGDAPFTPQNQDHAAWKLAQQDYAARTNGRSLDADLRAGGLTDEIMAKLTPTWQAFKSNRSRHAATYQESLARYTGGQAEPGASAIASAGPVAEGEAPKDEGGAQAKEMAAQQQQAAQEQASSGGSGGGGALPAAPVGVTVPEISNPIVGGGEPVNMAGARTVASRGLPPVRPARKSNTWAALRAALTKDAA